MADVSQHKKNGNPERIMGHESTSLEGPVLFYETGSFAVDNGVTVATIPTGLRRAQNIILTPLNTYGKTAMSGFFSDMAVDLNGKITLNFTDPANAAGAKFNYLLIGTV